MTTNTQMASTQSAATATPQSQDKTYTLDLSGWSDSISLWVLIWFTLISIGVYGFTTTVYSASAGENIPVRMSQTLDIAIFTVLIVYIFFQYYSSTEADKESYFVNKVIGFRDFMNVPFSIFSIIIFMAGIYLIIYSMGIPMNENKSIAVTIMENVSVVLAAMLLIHGFFRVVFNVNVVDIVLTNWFIPKLNEWFPNKKKENFDGDATPAVTTAAATTTTNPAINNAENAAVALANEKEVYNVSQNIYSYEEAPAVCSVLGGKLATYKQVEDAYKKGAEWCNYGWTDGRMALFPTQETTWENGDEETRKQCGRPGINGGIIDDKNARYGVNCYGIKPKASDEEMAMMRGNNNSELEDKIRLWRENSGDFLALNGFNEKQWSEYNK